MSILDNDLEKSWEIITPNILKAVGFRYEKPSPKWYSGQEDSIYEHYDYRDLDTSFIIQIVFSNTKVHSSVGDGRHGYSIIKKPLFCITYLKKLKHRYTFWENWNDRSYMESRILPSSYQLLEIIKLCHNGEFKKVREILKLLKR